MANTDPQSGPKRRAERVAKRARAKMRRSGFAQMDARKMLFRRVSPVKWR